MKRGLCLLLSLALLLSLLPGAAQGEMIITTMDEMTPEQIEEYFSFFFNDSSSTEIYTATPVPPHNYEVDYRYLGFWVNPKDGCNYAKWKVEGNDLLFSVCVENVSDSYVIDAVDVALYAVNAYGEIIVQDDDSSDGVCFYSLDLNLKPGKHTYTRYCRMEGKKSAQSVYCALVRYHVKDFVTVTCDDPRGYTNLARFDWRGWTIR